MPSLASPALGTSRTVRRIQRRHNPFSLLPLALPLILCVNVSFPAIPSGHSGSLVRNSRVYAASACAAGVR